VISLHRQNGQPILVNADLIEIAEASDGATTAITLTSGNTLVVTEPLDAVRAAVVAFRRSIALQA
jgi:uncharacterized protein YlzI (FlbEa/FlbD family)